MSSTNHFDVYSHLVHDIHAVFKGKHNTFLSRTGDMRRMMNIEIQTKDGTIHLLILQHTFRTISKRQNRQTFRANRHTGRKVIQLIVSNSVTGYRFLHPGIQDTYTINTQ